MTVLYKYVYRFVIPLIYIYIQASSKAKEEAGEQMKEGEECRMNIHYILFIPMSAGYSESCFKLLIVI